MPSKSLFASKTLLGALLLFIVTAARWWGIELAADDPHLVAALTQLLSVLDGIFTLVGLFLVVWGRITATKRIELPTAAARLLLLLLLLLVLAGCAGGGATVSWSDGKNRRQRKLPLPAPEPQRPRQVIGHADRCIIPPRRLPLRGVPALAVHRGRLRCAQRAAKPALSLRGFRVPRP
jgi:uncharacterized membrane protein